MKVVIVGGVAGGASTAARLRRLDEHAEIIMLERGEYISFANCGLPYHIGGIIPQREDLLVQTPQQMETRFKIDIRTRHQVDGIDREAQKVTITDLEKGSTYEESYDYLVLSPGARPIRPPLPGIDLPGIFSLRTMDDMDGIIEYIKSRGPQRAVVVGGGFIGLEMAENLHQLGLAIDLVEMAPQVLPPLDGDMAAVVHKHLERHGVGLYLNNGVTGFSQTSEGLLVHLSSGQELATQLVLLCIGVRPETELAQGADLTIGPRGGILVNEYLQTSDPRIYAIGDAIEFHDPFLDAPTFIPLAGPANKQGRIVANNICGLKEAYKGSQGTAIVQIFDLHAASTGYNSRTLAQGGKKARQVVVHPLSHAGYFPGAQTLTLKIMFDDQGRLLGAQCVGKRGVDKRIDVLATAMRGGMTVFDLQTLDLAYAPPFSSAKDPVNLAGYVAGNVLHGVMDVITWEELEELDDAFLLDIREPGEYARGHLPGAVNIPLDSLRERLDEIPKEREIIVYCRVGQRAHVAGRILRQRGFDKVRNLTGGYITYRAVGKP
ncbi:MAG: FAD-dependent oxidoreductase [Limnochordia bacterium]|jgi:NADPH-dependent 2,4-dienoyl-CoA reductase/sulfur reductase-like enzyme/rhodanese-related sulfurtransferase